MQLVVGINIDVWVFDVALKLVTPRQCARDYPTENPFHDPTHQYFEDWMAARFEIRSLSNCTA